MSETQEKEQIKQDEEETIRSKETSILFEPIALVVLFIGLIAAIWFRFLPLIIVSAFLLVLSLLIFTWKRRSLKKVQPSIRVPKSRLFVGDEFEIEATVKNNKWLPLIWLEWEFPERKLILWGKELQKTYIMRLLWLLWYQQVNWTITGKAVRRGIYHIGQVTLRSGDGFRFSEKEESHQLHNVLFVYPKIIPIQVPPFRTSLQWEAKGKKGGFIEDPLLIDGIRDYEAGDEWQRFNWRASARLGKLQTNVYQPVVSEQLMTYVDVQTFLINEKKFADEPLKQEKYNKQKENDFEKTLSVIASLMLAYQDRGIKSGFASNGVSSQNKELQPIPPSQDLTSSLDQLARITQKAVKRSNVVLDELLHAKMINCPLFIFCERITKDHVLWYEQNAHHVDVHFYYMHPSIHVDKLQSAAKSMEQLSVEMEVSGS